MALSEKGHGTGTGSAVIAITGVTAGASLVVAWAQVASATRTYTASSSVDGAFTGVAAYNPSRAQGQLRLDSVTAGDHTITLTANTGTVAVWAWVYEESLGFEAGATTPTGGGATTDPAATTHYCAPTGELDSASQASLAVIAVGTLANTPTTTTEGAGYTKGTTASNLKAFCQYRSTTGPITDDRGQFTNTGGTSTSQGTMALYTVKAGGSPAPSSSWGRGSAWWIGL